MLPNYYRFFGIDNFSEFKMAEDQINSRLLFFEHQGIWKDDYIITRVEAGQFVLTDFRLKVNYDFVLKHGMKSVLINPLRVIYLLSQVSNFVIKLWIINKIKAFKE